MKQIRFIKDFKEHKVGKIVYASKKSAESFISNGYAEYVESPTSPNKPTGQLDYKTATKELSELAGIGKPSKYIPNQINWLEGEFWDSWDKVKGHSKKQWGHKENYETDEIWSKFFLAHDKDFIIGKPQLIEQVQKKIPLVKFAVNKIKDKEIKEEIEVKSFFFFDERFDKRYDGFQKDSFALDFWIYRIITAEGKEYYLMSQVQLPNCSCTFKGMVVELDDFAEMSRSMKLKSLSRLFFVKEFEPSIKTLSKQEIVNFTQTKAITESQWFDYIAKHPLGTYNRFPQETEYLRSAHLLSGKHEGYPLHLAVLGKAGTKKSKGFLETISSKFEVIIQEAGSSRLKALTPSFKETPADIGYIAKCERIAFIDEIGKMIEHESIKSHNPISNLLGELNLLLDHNERIVGSGNSNNVKIKASCKVLIASNPVGSKSNLSNHIGLIDPTTMSRFLWWVQDSDETEFCLSSKSIEKTPRTHMQEYAKGGEAPREPTQAQAKIISIENRKKEIVLKMCSGEVLSKDDFITLFDSCYNFCCGIDENEVKRLNKSVISLCPDRFKDIWKARGEHHITLVIDGLVKTRCLFKDYDPTFTPKQEDYDLAEKILMRMANAWNSDFNYGGSR
jgi:hypothetical protein